MSTQLSQHVRSPEVETPHDICSDMTDLTYIYVAYQVLFL